MELLLHICPECSQELASGLDEHGKPAICGECVSDQLAEKFARLVQSSRAEMSNRIRFADEPKMVLSFPESVVLGIVIAVLVEFLRTRF